MKIRWCVEKSRVLKFRYGVSFEDIVRCRLICMTQHPSRGNQELLLYERDDYIWVVPFVKDEDGIFLKTLFPNRKYTRLYRKGELNEEENRLE